MTTTSIIEELKKLTTVEKLLVIEKILKSIRQESEGTLDLAVDSLYDDYKTDNELTIFNQLDSEPFYEAR
ncbi:MAG TPA: hypothetical protein VEZ17_17010 [Chitinophagaceae bacterium]|nr:hypothetical protein [Chitinophagaceae bacterium]